MDVLMKYAVIIRKEMHCAVVGGGHLAPDHYIPEGMCPGVGSPWGLWHVVLCTRIPVHQAFPPVLNDARNVRQPFIKWNNKDQSITGWSHHLLKCSLPVQVLDLMESSIYTLLFVSSLHKIHSKFLQVGFKEILLFNFVCLVCPLCTI